MSPFALRPGHDAAALAEAFAGGGALLFYDERGNVARGFTPSFNTLNLFRVPQPHSVGCVTPLAGAPRYAVTGWLRARE